MAFTDLELKLYMERCIDLARQTSDSVPKPYVGALVASPSGEVLGEGYKKFLPGTSYLLHAERVALDNAGMSAKGAYLVTTLEPCSRITKRQVFMSCSELIVESGVIGVVFGLHDGKRNLGTRYLEKNGIDVQHYIGMKDIIAELMW